MQMFLLLLASMCLCGSGMLAEDEPFKISTDGRRALFEFRDAEWDALFGGISLRQMFSLLNATTNEIAGLKLQWAADKAASDARILQLETQLATFIAAQKVCSL
jgi:hypothetical protein